MVEVYSGSRPGRPTLLLVLSAVSLTLALGAAWYQTLERRALAPERPLAETPLFIRPPAGWIELPGRPGVFELYDPGVDPTAEQSALKRRVQFGYTRVDAFIPAADLLSKLDRREKARSIEVRAARIGIVPGIEARRVETYRVRGYLVRKQTILRLAVTPRGEVLRVEYWPLMEPSLADLKLMDEMCSAVRFAEECTFFSGEEAKRRAGVNFATPAECEVFADVQHGLASLYVVGNVESLPAWAVVVRRSWLGPERTVGSLLEDLRDVLWRVSSGYGRVTQWGGRDREIAALDMPTRGDDPDTDGAAYAVARSPKEVALVMTLGESWREMDACRVSADIAHTLAFDPAFSVVDIDAAGERGAALVKLLNSKGAVPWWSGAAVESYFEARTDAARTGVRHQREPAAADDRSARESAKPSSTGRKGDFGYYGAETTMTESGRPAAGASEPVRKYTYTKWFIDGLAQSYELAWYEGADADVDPLRTIRERRAPGDAVVEREFVARSGRTVKTRFLVGAAFVAPPVELLAAAIAARAEEDTLVEVAPRLARRSSYRLIRALPPCKTGELRALIVEDFDPCPRLVEFDTRDESTMVPAQPGWAARRVTDATEIRVDPFFRLLRQLPQRHVR